MLSKADNEMMCRVGADTPMGKAFRHYWLPVMLSSELPEADGAPFPVEVCGERIVVFRDSAGVIGALAEHCCHRGASLLLGRVEECGIRCIYHGWKFAVDGTVLETPNVADERFKKRFRARSYPIRDAGGLVWIFLGEAASAPPLPNWAFMNVPARNRLPVVAVANCNYVQLMEGVVDSSHLSILHTVGLKATDAAELDFAKKTNHMQFDAAPRLEAEETDFGFHYVALRRNDRGPEPVIEARVAPFIAPCFVLNPNGDLFFAFIPINDERVLFFHVWWDREKAFGEEPLRSQQLSFVGLDRETLAESGMTRETSVLPDRARRENNFHQDREAMRRGHFTGLPGFTQEDAAVSMSPGPIRDRSKEMLSVADVAIGRLYRSLLKCAHSAANGQEPLAVHADVSKISGACGALKPGAEWRDLVPSHQPLVKHSATPQ